MAEKQNFDGKILDSLADRGISFSPECIHNVSVADENSILELQNALTSTASFYNNSDELVVNITGGTKPMSIATYNFFSTRIANIVYMLNDDKILNCKNDEKTDLKIAPPLTCNQHLLAHGFKVQTKPQNHFITNKDILKIIRLIAADFGHEELVICKDKKQWDKFRDKGGDPGTHFEWGPNISDQIKQSVSNIQNQLPESRDFWGKVLTGEWLEIFIWDLLVRNMDYLNIHDVQLGPVVSKDGVPNELDVAFMKGTSFNFIECKSGAQNHGSSQDVFHKIESIKKNFGALLVYSHLASSSKNIFDKDNQIKKEVKLRAELYKCKIICAKTISQLAKVSTAEQEYEILKPYV